MAKPGEIAKILAFSIGIGAGSAVIGHATDEYIFRDGVHGQFYDGWAGYEPGNVNEAEELVVQVEAEADREMTHASGRFLSVLERIGTECVFAMSVYTGSYTEDTAANYLLEEPDKCGTSRTEILKDFRALEEAEEQLDNVGEIQTRNKNSANKLLGDYKEAISDDAGFSGSKAMGILGSIVGLGLGIRSVSARRSVNQ